MSKSEQPVSMNVELVVQSRPVLDQLQQLIDDLDTTSSFSFSSHEKYFFFQLYNNISIKMSKLSRDDNIEFSSVFELISNIFKDSVTEIQQQNNETMELVWKDKKVKQMLLDVLANSLFKEINQQT